MRTLTSAFLLSTTFALLLGCARETTERTGTSSESGDGVDTSIQLAQRDSGDPLGTDLPEAAVRPDVTGGRDTSRLPPPEKPPVGDCIPAANATGHPGHNQGQKCMSCHATLTGKWRMTLAGTLYSDAAGRAPVGGATIVVVDSAGAKIELVTHETGNFYTSQAVRFPVKIVASRCPEHVVKQMDVRTGDCNSCHIEGSRIRLPG